MMNTNIDEQYINTAGGKIYAKQWVPADMRFDTPIVLLHDSIGCVDLWRGFPALMATTLSCQVIAYDRLGYGKSDPRHELPGVEFIEEEAVGFVSLIKKSLTLEKYILCGYSVGGSMCISVSVY